MNGVTFGSEIAFATPLPVGAPCELGKLLLEPLDLTAKIGPKGYVISRKPKADSSVLAAVSKRQQTCAARIERKLKEGNSTRPSETQGSSCV